MHKKAIIYLRLSTKKEVTDARLGLEAQRTACRNYCYRENIQIVETFEEIVSACVPFEKRLVFPKVVEACTTHQAMLVVAVQDRLTRSLSDWDGFNSRRIYGRRTPQLIVAESPHSSAFEMDIRAVFAQEERRRIGERTRKALAEKKALGYEIGKVGRDNAITKARQETQEAIDLAIQLRRNEKISCQAIADLLNRRGYTTSRGTPWSRENLWYRLKALQ